MYDDTRSGDVITRVVVERITRTGEGERITRVTTRAGEEITRTGEDITRVPRVYVDVEYMG